MSLEATIAENTQALRDLIAALSLRSPGAVAYAEQKALVVEPLFTPAPKSRKAKPEVVAEPAPVVETAPAVISEPVVAPEPVAPAPPALTYDDIKVPFLTQLVAKRGRDAAAALLKQFGVPEGGKLSDIPQDRWAEVLVAINERVAS